LPRYSKLFALTSALTLTVVGSAALFATMQNFSLYMALLKGQLYTPIVNSTETLFDRTFGRMGFLLLRPALWPLIVFVTLQMGATYAISTLLRFEGRFAFIRALTAAAGMSLLMTASILTRAVVDAYRNDLAVTVPASKP
jgi:hypothetical protein